MKPSFRKKLSELINCESMESGSDTPDFILAEYLADCVEVYNRTVRAREKWYGREKVGIPTYEYPKESKGPCHEHFCYCGGITTEHQSGEHNCLREMVPFQPEKLEGDRWRLLGIVVTGYTLREQRGYHQHPCGCWSRAKGGSTNSL